MPQSFRAPDGVSVDAVDWLPSGAGSGLARVRGRRRPGGPAVLPVLVLGHDGLERRFESLPDPRVDRDGGAWRGAYVIDAALAAAARSWTLEWPDGARAVLERPPVTAEAQPEPPAAPPGGEVVDRAVLAERRARRAEAAEQAQAKAAREALHAAEVLELRAAEVEERLRAAEAERDALRARLAEAAPPVEADRTVEAALREEVRHLRAEVERLEKAPPPAPAGEAEQRAARLEEALAATIAELGELRLQLHEAQLARRSREVAWSADAVRLVVLEREHVALLRELDATRAELDAVRAAGEAAAAALEEARAQAAGAEAAHEETRRRFTARVAELRAARERIAELEAEVAAVRAEAERSVSEAVAAARAAAEGAAEERLAEIEAETAARLADAEASAAERTAALEAEAAAAQAEIGRLEAALADAGTARARAEAAAVAAAAERRAAEVAHAAAEEALRRRAAAPVPPARPGASSPGLADALAAAAERVRAAAPPAAETPVAPAAPERPAVAPPAPGVLEAAAAQARIASRRPAEPGGDRVAADLDAAAGALRERATIVSAPSDPPGDVARGGKGRSYPPLRGALVKLAHDDPAAAARLIAGLLPAQHRLVDGAVDYDLTIREAGTFAIRVADGATSVTPVEGRRGRSSAAFHVRAGATAVAELLAGVGLRPSRLGGPIRASGRVRRARAVAGAVAGDLPLADAVDAGARLDPVLALRCLAYAVHPSWTRGHDLVVEVLADDERVTVTASDAGLEVGERPAAREPDARVRLTADAAGALAAGREPAEPLAVEGDPAAVAQLRAWVDRAAGRTG